MTVATHDTNPPLPVPIASDAAGLRGLDDWLHAAASAQQLAQGLVHSFFVPQAYKVGNPRDEAATAVAVANATGAILLGQSLGLDPLTSLQQIYVVHGRPGLYAKMKVALAQREGHRVWDEEYTPEAATVCGQRRGSDDVVRIRITIEDAKTAGWTTNAAYAKTPADMLWARAASRVVDRIAADALFGMRSVEDLTDEPEPAPSVTVTAADILSRPAPEITARRAAPTTPPAPQAGPDTGSGAPPEARTVHPAAPSRPPLPGEEQAIHGPTAAQKSALGAVMNALDVSGTGSRARRLLLASRITARDISSVDDLTADEAQLVIDTLEGIAALPSSAERRSMLAQIEADQHPIDEAPAQPAEWETPAEQGAIDPWVDAPQES